MCGDAENTSFCWNTSLFHRYIPDENLKKMGSLHWYVYCTNVTMLVEQQESCNDISVRPWVRYYILCFPCIFNFPSLYMDCNGFPTFFPNQISGILLIYCSPNVAFFPNGIFPGLYIYSNTFNSFCLNSEAFIFTSACSLWKSLRTEHRSGWRFPMTSWKRPWHSSITLFVLRGSSRAAWCWFQMSGEISTDNILVVTRESC